MSNARKQAAEETEVTRQKTEQQIEKDQQQSPWAVFSINGLLMVIVLVGLALMIYYTLWPHR
jgi:hypothetical protein